MKRIRLSVRCILFVMAGMVLWCGPAAAQKPIVLGAPLSTAYLYGWDAERGIRLAVDEINAAGGVAVGEKTALLPWK